MAVRLEAQVKEERKAQWMEEGAVDGGRCSGQPPSRDLPDQGEADVMEFKQEQIFSKTHFLCSLLKNSLNISMYIIV